MPQSVEDLFRAAAILTGPSGSSDARSTHLKDVLRRRIIEYNEAVGKTALTDEMTLETLQSYTALEALSLLESLHEKLKAPDAPLPQEGTPTPGPRQVDALQHEQPLLGTRDINLISTLLSILFNWAVAPLLQRIVAAIPSTSASQGIARASIIDLTGLPHEFSTLSSISSRLLALVLPAGPGLPISQSGVTAALLNRQLSDLLVPCIVIGWLPKSLASDTMPTADKVRPLVMHLLSRYLISGLITKHILIGNPQIACIPRHFSRGPRVVWCIFVAAVRAQNVHVHPQSSALAPRRYSWLVRVCVWR